MSYPVSTVPDAIDYLLTAFQTQLNTDANPENILLYQGDDPGPNAPPDLVGIVDVVRNLEHFAMVGDGENLAMYEKYSVKVSISSAQRAATEGAAATALSARVWQLLAYLEYAVRLDPSLDSIVLTAWPGRATGGLVQVAPSNTGWICELKWQVDCEATQ